MKAVDVLILGAGFAGLASARALRKAGLSVRVLEARDRVGGRTAGGELAGLNVDIGGMWLSPLQTRLASLAKDYGVRTYPQPLKGDCSLRFRGVKKRAPEDGFDRALGFFERLQLFFLVRAIDAEVRNVDPKAPGRGPRAERLDRESVASWCARRTRSLPVQALVNLVCRAVLCADAHEISMLFFAFYARTSGSLETLLGMSGDGAQSVLFEGGVHQVAERMAEELGDAVRLAEPVYAVDQEEGWVHVETQRGTHTGRRAILCLPPPHASRIAFRPALTTDKRTLLARQPMGSCIKAWLAYDRPFWRADGCNGFLVSDDQPFTPVFDGTPPGQDIGLLAGFFEGPEALQASRLSEDERRAQAIESIAAHLGDRARRPIGYVEHDWCADPWSDGCYGAYLAPGVLTSRGDALRAPHGRIYWAGTETATVWTGYIEGALESGERAVRELLDGFEEERSNRVSPPLAAVHL